MGARDFAHVKANTGGRSGARRAEQYYRRRREQLERDGVGRWRSLDPVVGERERMIEEVGRRESKREVTHMTVVVSPERGDLQITDEKFRRIAAVWTTNRNGREVEALGYVHRDTEHAHLHLMVARGYYSSAELERNKEQTRAIVREIERDREMEQMMDRIHEAGLSLDRDREREREADRELGPDLGSPAR